MAIPSIHNTETAEETKALGRAFTHTLTPPRVICLYGDLGSGKTTFIQGIAAGLGIQIRLLSPTFIIVRRYSLSEVGFLYHLDLYRLEKEEELAALGFADMLADPQSIVVVEWAEKLHTLLPKNRIDVRLRVLDDGKHEIKIEI